MDASFDGDDPFAGNPEVSGVDDLGAELEAPGLLDDHLWLADDGRLWDLGPADVDTDDDGHKDSLTRMGPDGMTVYTDSDHDGRVDRITSVGSDGEYSSSSLDPQTGTWSTTERGRLN